MKFLRPEWHDKLSSTNTVLLDWIKEGKQLQPGFVLATLEQTAGHGRHDHHWFSQAGRDLTFSFLLSTRNDPSKLTSLSMAIALGTASALDTFGILTQIKWPNDLLVRGRKIGGILSEQSDVKYTHGVAVVVGIGINVNMRKEDTISMKNQATSLLIETGKKNAIESVLDLILEMLPQWIDRWEDGGFPALRDDLIARCCFMGEKITVREGNDRKSGIMEGFGDKGQLLLRGEDRSVYEVWAGDFE